MKKLIKLTSIIQNVNPVLAIYPPPSTKESKYQVEILDVEIWLLDTFSLYVSIFNFDNSESVKAIFAYFTKKIKNQKN